MKIRTDVNDILSQRAYVPSSRSQSAPVIRNTAPQQVDLRQSRGLTERLNNERSLNDALNIAIMSQSIIQKAMLVTSRLRSIAAEAMNGGRVNAGEVQTALADIQAAMQLHGERITPPPQMSSIHTDIAKIPAVSGDAEAVADIAQGMQKGNIPDPETFHGLLERLNARSGEMNTAIQALQSSISSNASRYPYLGSFNPLRAVPETSASIVSNPQTALSVQGNISRDNAGRILGV